MQRTLAAILGSVQRGVRDDAMLAPGERVLVAVSGGPDSVGLLLLLARLRKKLGIALVAAHVNHRLRGRASDLDEACAAEAAAQAGVPFARAELPGGLARGGNLEGRARTLRYAALRRLARAHGCTKIATGHTLDDQAETVLMRLIRGSGGAGLAGIVPRRADGVIRPLLACRRAEVGAAVRLMGGRYRVDRSNRDRRFLRTHVRERVLPLLAELNPSIARGLANTAAAARGERTIVRQWSDAQLRRHAAGGALDAAALATLPAALRSTVVRRWLRRQGVPARGISARHVAAVVRLATGKRPAAAVHLPHGRQVRRAGDQLLLGEPPLPATYDAQPLTAPGTLHLLGGWRIDARPLTWPNRRAVLPGDLWSAVLDAGAIASPLVVRPPVRGERVRPLGLGGRRKLSDLFIDRKVPAGARHAYPVVASGAEVLWVPGVVRGEGGRVGGDTSAAVWLRARRVVDQVVEESESRGAMRRAGRRATARERASEGRTVRARTGVAARYVPC